jgi:sulfite exporter TauE/SafE
VFDFDQPILIAGLLLGIASSLHCLGMCTGIAVSLCMASAPSDHSHLLRDNILINAGRITGYMLAGMAVGALGTAAFGVLDRSMAHLVLRWAAAVSLGWIGLSMMGFVPIPEPVFRLGAVVSDGLARLTGNLGRFALAGRFAAGCAWGFVPCAMVYAALFYAMLSGSWLNGAIVMLGFGLGTLPPIFAAGMGLPWLRARTSSPWLQRGLGLAIMLVGVASAIPTTTIVAWCKAIV